MNIDTKLQFAQETEASLIGNFLLFQESLQLALEAGLVSDDFVLVKHQLIFNALVELKESNLPYDITSLLQRLKDYQIIDKVGGVNFLAELQNQAVGLNYTAHYVNILKSKTYRRKIIELSKNLQMLASDGSKEVEYVLDEAEKNILNITRNRFVSDFKETPLVIDEVIENIKALQRGGGTVGIKTSFGDLDHMTKGFKRGDLIILAARPSVGKTAFALNLALNIAGSKSGNLGAVAIFSLEMGADQLINRMLSTRSRIDGGKLIDGKLTNDDFTRLMASANQLKKEKIKIDDTAGIKVSEIFSKCRKLSKQEGLSCVIIDYIQLINSTNNNYESRQQQVSEISRNLKALARELNVPVVALSQLSRSVEKREDKRPMLSDLRESGALEQDADIVMFLYRGEYYDKQESKESDEQEVELNIAKHRNGPTGTIFLHFKKSTGSFISVQFREKNQ